MIHIPEATVIVSERGKESIFKHYREQWNFKTVKTGDSIDLGKDNIHLYTILHIIKKGGMIMIDFYDKVKEFEKNKNGFNKLFEQVDFKKVIEYIKQKESQQWNALANSIWNQVFRELERFQTMIPQLPSPLKDTATGILHSISLNPENINSGIVQLTNPPADITPQEWKIVNSIRNQIITAGHQWLDLLKNTNDIIDSVLKTQVFAGMTTSPFILESTNLVQDQWINAMNCINAVNEQTLQNMHEQNMEIGERWCDIFSGQPFIDLRLRRRFL